MFTKHVLLTSLALLLVAGVTYAQPTAVWVEDFNTDGEGSRYASNPNNYGTPTSANSYWGRNGTSTFSGFEGMYYWGGSDLDSGGVVPATLTFSGIALNGNKDLQLEGLFGAIANQFEAGEYIKVFYKDNNDAEETELLSFVSTGSNLSLSIDVDGTPVALTSGMAKFSKAFTVDGTTLTLIIKANNSSDGEILAFDNLKITGTVPEPMTMSLLALGGLGLLRRRRA